MNIVFSDRANRIKASEIRELLKLTTRPEILSFAGGLPAAELFPLEALGKVAKEVMLEEGHVALQYSPTEGFQDLREMIIKQRLHKVGIEANLDEICITSGSQQALDFVGKMFINEGDSVFVESPTYLGALNAFLAYGPHYLEIPLKSDGLDLEVLENMLQNGHKGKFLYTIPDYQNPSGITLSLEKRKQLMALANKYDLIVVEDAPYAELVLTGDQLPPLKSMDPEGRVIYLGTYSKTFTPGLRIGWVVANKTLINKFVQIKQGSDLQTSSLDQRIAARYMKQYHLDDHIDMIKEVYRKRRDVMIETMKKHFHKDITFVESTGGLFTWVCLKEGLDTKKIMEEALAEHVAFVPGVSFFASRDQYHYMRLNYSCMPEDKIKTGMERLAKVLNRYYTE